MHSQVEDVAAKFVRAQEVAEARCMQAQAGHGGDVLEGSGEHVREDGQEPEHEQDREADDAVAPAQEVAEEAGGAAERVRSAAVGAPDGRGRHERTLGSSAPYTRSASRLNTTTDTDTSRKMPCSSG